MGLEPATLLPDGHFVRAPKYIISYCAAVGDEQIPVIFVLYSSVKNMVLGWHSEGTQSKKNLSGL